MKVLSFLVLIWLSSNLFGQSIWTNPITGTNPNTSNPYTTGQTVDPNITVSGIGRGAGIVGTNANDRYNANSWNTASIDLTAYFEWTLTPNVGCEIDFTSFVYTSQRSDASIANFAFRSSIDGFISNIGAPTFGGTTIDLTGINYQNINSPITFRFYAWGAGASGNTFSINSFTFNGNTSCGTPNTLSFDPTPPNSYTINCNTTATANIDITTTGTFNAGNTYTIQLSDALGDFTNATVIGSTSSTSNFETIPVTIPIGTAEGTGYRIRIISSNPSIISNDNGFNISIIDNCTITTGALSSNIYSVSCSSGSSGSVSFTTSEAMQPGNVYSVQLSDASGDFTASTTIGTLTSTATSGSINYTIPETTPTGANYLIRVVSSSPNTLGSSSTPITITLTDGPCAVVPPHLTSVIINSCNPTCTEGYNEIVFGSTGDYSIDVNATNFDFLYGATFPGTNYTDVLVNNATGINQLNTAAGCPGLFVDATGTTIPAGSSWMLVNTDICEEALTWSGLCGSGPIYVIFQDDPNWNTSGNFANNPSASSPIRYFQTEITTTSGNTFTINYTTDGNQYPDSDGVFATFDEDGGPATTYGDNNCVLSPELLPATTVNLKATSSRNGNQITWQTQSEQNNDYFTLLHSTDGYNFLRIKEIEGAGQSNSLLSYSHLHPNPPSGINYYKLRSTDYDGTVYEKGLVSVMVDAESTYYDPISACLIFNEEGNFDLYSIEGKVLQNIRGSNRSLPDLKGVVLVRNLRTGTIERLFIP